MFKEAVLWNTAWLILVTAAAEGLGCKTNETMLYFHASSVAFLSSAIAKAVARRGGQRPNLRRYLKLCDKSHFFQLKCKKARKLHGFPSSVSRDRLFVSAVAVRDLIERETYSSKAFFKELGKTTNQALQEYDAWLEQLAQSTIERNVPAATSARTKRRRDQQAREQVQQAIRIASASGVDLQAAMDRTNPSVEQAPAKRQRKSDDPELQNFTRVAAMAFPELWEVMYGRDLGVTSYVSLGCIRTKAHQQPFQPPPRWVHDYSQIVNAQGLSSWDVSPRAGETHSCLTTTGQKGKGRLLTNKEVVCVDFREIIRWHIYQVIAEGNDLSPFAIAPGTDGSCSAPGTLALDYKLTFDTTQTNGYDLFMLGVIPHNFVPKSKVQSAKNVLVLSLARLAETPFVIESSLPTLEQDITDIRKNGLDCMVGDLNLKVRIDFHIAADMKALWLALGTESFACPFCNATGKKDFNKIQKDESSRTRKPALGVPPENIHLCALHAQLRVVERLFKNALHHIWSTKRPRDRSKIVKAIQEWVKSSLNRKKFVITANMREMAVCTDLVDDDDDIYMDVADILGHNVGRIVNTNTYIKMSSLTGAQAANFVRKKLYKKLIDMTEDACLCQARAAAAAAANLPTQSGTCRRCLVEKVWEDFAEHIFPLINATKTPDRLLNAKEQGRLEEELASIDSFTRSWLSLYVSAYGGFVTPYIHVVGKHLAEMLRQEGNCIGVWSQQGFEACHKLIRHIYNCGTSHDGGRTGNSALVQIILYLYRCAWAKLRETLLRSSDVVGFAELQCKFEDEFGAVDEEYQESFPKRSKDRYVRTACRQRLSEIRATSERETKRA